MPLFTDGCLEFYTTNEPRNGFLFGVSADCVAASVSRTICSSHSFVSACCLQKFLSSWEMERVQNTPWQVRGGVIDGCLRGCSWWLVMGRILSPWGYYSAVKVGRSWSMGWKDSWRGWGCAAKGCTFPAACRAVLFAGSTGRMHRRVCQLIECWVIPDWGQVTSKRSLFVKDLIILHPSWRSL